MTYATQQDLIDLYGERELIDWSDRDGAGVIDAAVVQRALESADALIDSYIARRYELPLTETPRLLVELAAKIARYELAKDGAHERVVQGNADARKTLFALSSGAAELPLASGESAPGAEPGDVRVEGPERIFSRETLKGF